MGAAWFVGRVGGLAVALGVGAAVLCVAPMACADSPQSPTTASASNGPGASGGSRGPHVPAARTAAARPDLTPSPKTSHAAASLEVMSLAARHNIRPVSSAPTPSPAVGLPAGAGELALGGSTPPAAVAGPLAVASSESPAPQASSTSPVLAAVPAVSASPKPAATSSAATTVSVIRASRAGVADGAGGDPLAPDDSPLSWAVVGVARRQSVRAAGATASASSAAASTSLATPSVASANGPQVWTGKGITVTSQFGLENGNIIGLFSATSSRADTILSYTALGGSNGGKLALGTVPGFPQSLTVLPYATWLDPGGTKGTEQFGLQVREYTNFDAVFNKVVNAVLSPVLSIPGLNVLLASLLVNPGLKVINSLQDTPLLGTLLAPLIGVSVVAPLEVNVAALAPANTPVAFTYKVTSFDGTKISTNFFPASGLSAGQTAPTAIIAPGFGFAGVTNPFATTALRNEVPGIFTLNNAGYNVVTYDPRGRFDSGGEVHLANPNYEGRDVSSLVDWIASSTPATLNAPNDPQVGLLGGSYGAALQFAAASDHRIDAMVPVNGWDTLVGSFYPQNTFRTAYAALTIMSLLTTGSRVYPPLYFALGSGFLFNWLGQWAQNVLNASNPPLNELTTPTLLMRGVSDVLFPLEQGTASAQTILDNGNNVPLKMLWFDGGHGAAIVPPDQATVMNVYTLAWLNQYVKGNSTAANAIPNFTWFDQKGTGYNSTLMPFQPGFNNLPDVVATSKGGLLGIVPILGGSGGGSLVNATKASNAINIAIPTDALLPGTQVVGTPTVSFTYSGLGTGKAVFAQVVDNTTGQVLGSVVAPVPVTLNGAQHTVSVGIGEIAYTVAAGDSLTVQITSSATAFENPSVGVIKISNVTVTLPNRTTPAS